MPAGLWPVLQEWLIGPRAIWPIRLCLFFSLNRSVYVLTIWLKLDMCDFITHTGLQSLQQQHFADFLRTESAMEGLNQLLPLHSTHIFSKHKGLSVSLISITKSPWSVLQACSRSSASLGLDPPPPIFPQLPTMSCQKALVLPSYTLSASVVHSMPKPPDRGLFLWAQWHLAPMPGCLLSGGAVSLLLLVPC